MKQTRGTFQKSLPTRRGHKPIDGKTAAYVCSNYECRLPTDDPARMLELIREGRDPEKVSE